MATKTFTLTFGASDYALSDRALTANITYARDSNDNAAKFTCGTKGMSATIESGWGAATGITWETILGLTDVTVTQVQVTNWKKKLVSNTKLTGNSVKFRILSGTTTVHSAGELLSVTLATTPTDGSYGAQSAGPARAVDVAYQAGTTEIRFELEQSFTTSGSSGSATVDQRYDDIEVTVTYAPAPIEITPSAGTLSLSSAATIAALGFLAIASSGALALTGYAPDVSVVAGGGITEITPAAGALTLTGYAPDITRGGGAGTEIVPGAGALSLVGFAPQVRRGYSTSFASDQDPLSTSVWLLGKTDGGQWSDVRCSGGIAHGKLLGGGSYDDAVAILKGTWTADQTASATFYSNSPDVSHLPELELFLRGNIGANSIAGYEILVSVETAVNSSYFKIVRWNGPNSDFEYIYESKHDIGTGDLVTATIEGYLITVYRNGVPIAQVEDTNTQKRIATGSPGIAMYCSGSTPPEGWAAYQDKFGWSDFSAHDGVDHPADASYFGMCDVNGDPAGNDYTDDSGGGPTSWWDGEIDLLQESPPYDASILTHWTGGSVWLVPGTGPKQIRELAVRSWLSSGTGGTLRLALYSLDGQTKIAETGPITTINGTSSATAAWNGGEANGLVYGGRLYRFMATWLGNSGSVLGFHAQNKSGFGGWGSYNLGTDYTGGLPSALLETTGGGGSQTTDTGQFRAKTGLAIIPGCGTLTLVGYAPTLEGGLPPEKIPNAGTLALTGYAPTITLACTITPGAGALSVTSAAPTTTFVRTITPASGSLALSSAAPTTTLVSVTIPLAGALTVTSAAPVVAKGHQPAPGAGSLALTSTAPVLTTTYFVIPAAGALAVTGSTPDLTLVAAGRVITPSGGTLALTGGAAPINVGFGLTPTAGVLSVSSAAPILTLAAVAMPASGALALTSDAPTITITREIAPQSGALTLTGYAPSLGAEREIVPGAGALTLSGGALVQTTVRVLLPASGTLSLSSAAPTTTLIYLARPAQGTLTLTGTTVLLGREITPAAGALAVTGYVSTLTRTTILAPSAGALTLTTAAPSVDTTTKKEVTPGCGTLTFSSAAPLLTIGTNLTPSAGALSVTSAAPVTTFARALTPSAGTLTLAGFAPSATVSYFATPSTGTLTLTASAPRLDYILSAQTGSLSVSGANVACLVTYLATPATGTLSLSAASVVVERGGVTQREITPSTGTLLVTGYTPLEVVTQIVRPGAGALTLSADAPTASVACTMIPSAGALVLTGYAPGRPLGYQPTPNAGVLSLTSAAPQLTVVMTVTPSTGVLTFTGPLVSWDLGGMGFRWVLRDLGLWLEAQGHGTVGVDIFLDEIVALPINAVLLYEEPGLPATEAFDGVQWEAPCVGIAVRDVDYATGRLRIERIYRALLGLANQKIGLSFYQRVDALTTPYWDGDDEHGNPVFVVDVACAKTLSQL